jgi:hypothetical protein
MRVPRLLVSKRSFWRKTSTVCTMSLASRIVSKHSPSRGASCNSIYTYVYVYLYVHMYVYMYIYTYICTHKPRKCSVIGSKPSAYVRIRQHTSAYVSIRQHIILSIESSGIPVKSEPYLLLLTNRPSNLSCY